MLHQHTKHSFVSKDCSSVEKLVSDELACSVETSRPSSRVGVDGRNVGGGCAGESILVGVVGDLGVDVGLRGSNADGIHSRLPGVDEGLHGGEDVVGAAGGAEEALAGAGALCAVGRSKINVGDERLGREERRLLRGRTAGDGRNVSLASLAATSSASS